MLKFQNAQALQISKISLKKMMRDYTNLKDKFSRYQLSISQTLQNEIEKVLPLELYVDMNSQIDKDISTLKDELKDLGNNINKLSNRVLSLHCKPNMRNMSQSLKARQQSTDRHASKTTAGASFAQNKDKMMHPHDRSLS